MQLTESRVFELIGRLHAENREMAAENEATKTRNDLLVAEVRRLTDENARFQAELEQATDDLPAPMTVPKKKRAG